VLRWRDVDLAGDRITIRQSKTEAGLPTIDLLPALRDALTEHKAHVKPPDLQALVFATATGRAHNASNIRTRVRYKAVRRANETLAARGEVPLPDGLSPHKLRHTYPSLLVCLGVDPGAVMDQLGHANAAFTLRVYRHAMCRTPPAKRELATLVGLPIGHHMTIRLGQAAACWLVICW